ncbi:phosphate ABC transporter substrate-binding protein [Tistrella bauzanensis]|uniref:Phosphate ABC transporter substrate-binding protein n=1 Tax=Tistrella bauzanensis TaxID=657419 RepID=A0ABQ1IWM8_9PROT|nr:PstS family phosphate ABC transporter substrate-binding protein [Tistrella bauzanensis]GGB54074.1 phosphate ABC transporter substrate-binding protein [Tistrella bauzanensis]
MFKKAALLSAVAIIAISTPALARDQIRIVGSSTVYPFATAVAEEFGKTSGFPTPVIESTGSGGGLKLFCAGVGTQFPDITNSSRRIKKSEVEECAKNGATEVTEVKIGFDGIVLANNINGPTMDISRAEIWQALAKQVPVDGKLVDNPYKNWNEIDPSLPNEAIEVLGPPPTSGTRDAFVELVMEHGCEEFDAVKAIEDKKMRGAVCKSMREDGAFIEAGENDNLIVQKLVSTPTAFGIFGYSFLEENGDKVKAATVEGVAPEYDAISSGEYPVSRSMYFYVKNAHVGTVPGIKEYVTEFTSEDAFSPVGYLAQRGLIALPDAARAEVAKTAQSLTPMKM